MDPGCNTFNLLVCTFTDVDWYIAKCLQDQLLVPLSDSRSLELAESSGVGMMFQYYMIQSLSGARFSCAKAWLIS